MMNKDTVIRVKRAVGMTSKIKTGENIGQGTTEGAVISAASLDYTVNKFFGSSKAELSYGPEKILPLMFQDDICRLSLTLKDAQKGNDTLESAMEIKLLDFNLDKSCCLIMGSNQGRKRLTKDMSKNPLTLCKRPMNIATNEKYLEDMLSSNGLSDSVHTNILKRKGGVMLAIMKIKSYINDCRITTLGGLTAGI